MTKVEKTQHHLRNETEKQEERSQEHTFSQKHKKMIKKNNTKLETRVYLLASDTVLGMASTLLVTAKLYNLLKHFSILLIHPFEMEQQVEFKEKLDKIRVYFTNHSVVLWLRPCLPKEGGRFYPWSGSQDLTCLVAKKPKHKTGAIL